MVNHPNRKSPPPLEATQEIGQLVTDMEGQLMTLLGRYHRATNSPLWNAIEAAMGALGDVRAIVQKQLGDAP